MSCEVSQPLLASRTRRHELNAGGQNSHGNLAEVTFDWSRRSLKRFLSSRTHHYTILLLVSLDVSTIFTDIIISLFQCDSSHEIPGQDKAREVLGIVGLVFSSLFMLELIILIWAFGWA